MCRIVVAIALSLWPVIVAAFEIEEKHLFGPEGGQAVEIISTTDTEIFAPLIEAFLASNPGVAVHYTMTSSAELHRAIETEGAAFDLAVSSAMDLQMKLANDGFSAAYASAQTRALPEWARWRDHIFAFTQEPVVLAVSRSGLGQVALPATRDDLVRLLRQDPERFRGRIGTYDPNKSGAGYLFATQDARHSETYWRLAELMGGLDPKLYGSSGAMISDLEAGNIVLAYNVLGPYAAARLEGDPDAAIVELRDHTNVFLRTALIPSTARHPELGAVFLDFLLSEQGQRLLASESRLPRIDEAALSQQPHRRPIRLDPGLLVLVDPLMRGNFLKEWSAAVVLR